MLHVYFGVNFEVDVLNKITSILILLFVEVVQSAPHPATTSSALIAPQKGLFLSGTGFSLKAEKTNWQLKPVDEDSAVNVALFQPILSAKLADPPSLTVRVDKLAEKTTLDLFAKKWMRDYPSYGFDVLGAKPVQVSGQRAFLIDLVHPKKEKQLRQVIFQKDSRAVVLTCSDQKSTFGETLKNCNQIIRSFTWTK